jgi:hypothetical protein
MWFFELPQLARERVEIRIDAVILSGDDREIAIAAVMSAERHVDVGRARMKPRRADFRST